MKKLSQFTPDEDASLLLSWHCGDFSAFETLIWKHQQRVFNLALLLTGNEKIACDAVENSFVSAYQNIRAMKSTGRFSSWLIALVLKECREFNNYRSEEAEPSAEPELNLDDENSYAAALHKKLELCIRGLPSELSEVILLRYVRGFPLDRVEEILQINGEMLLSRLFEAQETLACWLRSDTDVPGELAALKAVVSSVHPEIRRNFSAYLDSSVEGEEKELTKAHLKSCGSCREALAELEWMVEDIKSIPDVAPPQWLATSIIEKVKIPQARLAEVKAPRSINIQITAAALLIAAIVIYSYLVQSKPEPVAEQQRSARQSAPSTHVVKKSVPSGTKSAAIPQGVFRNEPTKTDNSPGAEKSARLPSFPLPTELPPKRLLQPNPSVKPAQPLADTKSDQLQKREKPVAMQPALQEWGDPLPQGSSSDKK